MSAWGPLALVIALLVAPCLSLGFRLLGRPGGHPVALGVELAMFATTALLLWIVRRKEGKSWASLGLARPALRQTLLLTLGGLVATVAALAALVGGLQLLGIPSLQGDNVERPLWLLAVMVTRAGFVEEVTYRGVAIDHMAELTGSKTLGWLLPLLLFGALHYPQGVSGILIAAVAAGVLSALFLWKRNLWVNIAIHFLIDFVPNVLLPLLGLMK